MRSVLSGNSSYERAFQDMFLCSKIPESICCLFVFREEDVEGCKSSSGIKTFRRFRGTSARTPCAPLRRSSQNFERQRTDVVEAPRDL